MFYLIEMNYVGLNPFDIDQGPADYDHLVVQTEPAIAMGDNEEVINGSCGTTSSGVAYFAHGEYETLESAKEAAFEKFGMLREVSEHADSLGYNRNTVKAIYKKGGYEKLGADATRNWGYAEIKSKINADSTNEQTETLIFNMEREANSQGYTLSIDALREAIKTTKDHHLADRKEAFDYIETELVSELEKCLNFVKTNELDDFCCDMILGDVMKKHFTFSKDWQDTVEGQLFHAQYGKPTADKYKQKLQALLEA